MYEYRYKVGHECPDFTVYEIERRKKSWSWFRPWKYLGETRGINGVADRIRRDKQAEERKANPNWIYIK